MLGLAAPVILAELAWVLMGIVDTIIVAPLGPAAIGAVGAGSTLFFALMVLGMGTLFSIDTLVSQAFGAGRLDECRRWFVAGGYLAIVLAVGLMAIGMAALPLLGTAGVHPEVLPLMRSYLLALLWSVLPLLIFTLLRRYLQAMNAVRSILVIAIAANIVNAVGDWALVFGHLGAPALGVEGSAYATVASRIFMVGALAAVLVVRERRQPEAWRQVSWAIDLRRIRALVVLGAPAAVQIVLEVGVFAAVGLLASSIAPLAVAASQIVLNIAAFVFMVPYGLSSAAAVRVGQAVGRGDPPGARRAGWSALALGWAFAIVMSMAFLIAPEVFLRIFTADASVLSTGATLLALCAVFQLFDASQTIATGALRGLGQTRWPMGINLLGHWGVGLPLAWWLCFRAGFGVVGLWAGLTTGLIIIGAVLLAIWARMSRIPPDV